ncbi:hypothetical protein EVAR_47561_1 [Eumeta japonica]|uniref:Uncharacterized protein n=1 Tax=Eumeta variegata TaxID=151549 RepID=A0A4C1WN49_EUMVA|nr:hypothetical protein EVAR_47561_1 [Eumeta japonica]
MGEQSNAWRILLRNDRKSRHRRIKSDVAMNAWPPQASYPCVPMRTEHLDPSFCPLLHARFPSSLSWPGHLRYSLTDVPPQSNSPPGSVLEPDHAGVYDGDAPGHPSTSPLCWNETPCARRRESTAHRLRPTE